MGYREGESNGLEPADELADEQGVIPSFPPRKLDEQGRLVPLAAEERRVRASVVLRALKALDAIGDETDHREALEAIWAGRETDPS